MAPALALVLGCTHTVTDGEPPDLEVQQVIGDVAANPSRVSFGVNDDACAESDHDHGDEVLYGDDYQLIYDAVQALMPMDSSAS